MRKKKDDCSGATAAKCQQECVGTAACAVMVYHDKDRHCHTLIGAVTHAAFVAALQGDHDYQACMLV